MNIEKSLIRQVKESDAEEIITYLNQVGGESDGLTFGFNECKVTVEEERGWIREMKEPLNNVLLCFIGTELVSMLSLCNMGRGRVQHRAELGITVKKKYWNQGIASAMIKEAIAFCKAVGIEVIELQVKVDNIVAIRLYEKFGFQTIGVYKKFFKISGKDADAYLMNLYL